MAELLLRWQCMAHLNPAELGQEPKISVSSTQESKSSLPVLAPDPWLQLFLGSHLGLEQIQRSGAWALDWEPGVAGCVTCLLVSRLSSVCLWRAGSVGFNLSVPYRKGDCGAWLCCHPSVVQLPRWSCLLSTQTRACEALGQQGTGWELRIPGSRHCPP